MHCSRYKRFIFFLPPELSKYFQWQSNVAPNLQSISHFCTIFFIYQITWVSPEYAWNIYHRTISNKQWDQLLSTSLTYISNIMENKLLYFCFCFSFFSIVHTFPEDLIPFHKEKYTTTSTAIKQSTNCHFGDPILSIPNAFWSSNTLNL